MPSTFYKRILFNYCREARWSRAERLVFIDTWLCLYVCLFVCLFLRTNKVLLSKNSELKNLEQWRFEPRTPTFPDTCSTNYATEVKKFTFWVSGPFWVRLHRIIGLYLNVSVHYGNRFVPHFVGKYEFPHKWKCFLFFSFSFSFSFFFFIFFF